MKILKKLLSIFLCASILFVQLLFPTTAQAIESNVNLSNIKLDNVSLDNFSPNIFEYNITVEASKESLDISAESEDMSLNITGDIGSKNLIMGENQFTITVTSGDGLETQEYTLNITKAEVAIPTPSPTSTPEPSPSPQPSAEATQSPTPTVVPQPSTETTPVPAPTPSSSEIPAQTNEVTETPKPIEEISAETLPSETAATREIITTADGIVFDTETGTITDYTGTAIELNIPSNIEGTPVRIIGERAFEQCYSLTSVNIPYGVTGIEGRAFYTCSYLSDVSLPNSLLTISADAFSLTKISSITIPDSVTTLINNPFRCCKKLTEIVVSAGNPIYKSIDGVLFDKEITTLIQYPTGKLGTTYTIPNSVLTIGRFSMGLNPNLENIQIGNHVTAIKSYAFSNCRSLIEITIPDSVQKIEGYTFFNCNSLVSATIPSSVTNIEIYAFHLFDEGTYPVIPMLAIYGGSSTYAETYASENNIPFATIPGTDASLLNLSIDNTTVAEFNSTTFTYYKTINNSTESIEIGATSTDENATITGDTGTQSLDVGVNTFTITCTAEDGVILQDYIIIYEKIIENDYNNDGKVGMLDIIIVAQNYNDTNSDCDINSDGIVNIFDLVMLSNQIE